LIVSNASDLMTTTRGAPDTVSPQVRYHLVDEFPGWALAGSFLTDMIDRHKPGLILEIGSGANPTLGIGDVVQRKLRYVTSDIDRHELLKAAPEYEALCLDLERGPLPQGLIGQCDMIFSRMVNEHIRDGRHYHANIRTLLRPEGIAIHCSSTFYALPFVANSLMPADLTSRILNFFNPRDREQHEKFRAYYSWCRGPTAKMIRRFGEVGYDVLSYDGYFGHPYYHTRLPILDALERLKSRALLYLPMPLLCSYAVVVLRRTLQEGWGET
jgi:hypothetical protein